MSDDAWDLATNAYQPFYCEENVWKLLALAPEPSSWALVMVGSGGPLWMTAQRAAAPGEAVGWDYHVAALARRDGEPHVADFDSRLPFPVPLRRYLQESFPVPPPEPGRPMFRVISAEDYVARLKTDRRHMRRGDRWIHPPPPWPVLTEGESNLAAIIGPTDVEFGPWLSASQLSSRFV